MLASRRTALLVIASLIVAASPVYAGGGGGTKRPSRIVFTNNSSLVVGVTIDATSTGITNAITNKDVAAFTNAGGKFISVGGTALSRRSGHLYGRGDRSGLRQCHRHAERDRRQGPDDLRDDRRQPEYAGAIEISSSTTAPTTTTTTVTSAIKSGHHH